MFVIWCLVCMGATSLFYIYDWLSGRGAANASKTFNEVAFCAAIGGLFGMIITVGLFFVLTIMHSLAIVDENYVLDELLGNIRLLLVLFTNITIASTYLAATGMGKRNTG